MGRPRLFHALVVVGAGLLASCSGSSKRSSTPAGNTADPDAGVTHIDPGRSVDNPPPPPP